MCRVFACALLLLLASVGTACEDDPHDGHDPAAQHGEDGDGGRDRDGNTDAAPAPTDDDGGSDRDGASPADASDLDAHSAHDGSDGSLDAAPYDGPIRIATAVVAQTYHDFPILPVKQWCKFEVIFNVGPERLEPEHVKSIHVAGPNGYSFDFANAPFTLAAPNGYILNEPLNIFWYQAIFPGFLTDGEYTLTLTLTDGTTSSYSRTLRSNFALLDFYLAHTLEMKYEPSAGSFPADDTVLRWSTLRSLGGPDAYYNVWISPGTSFAIDPHTARGDTIFLDALVKDPKAGLNVGHSRKGSKKDPLPLGPQTWHPEIVDSNVLGEISMIIFPPAQHFEAVP
jgi:hypothetical protein